MNDRLIEGRQQQTSSWANQRFSVRKYSIGKDFVEIGSTKPMGAEGDANIFKVNVTSTVQNYNDNTRLVEEMIR